MTIALIIFGILAAFYVYAAVAFYFGFKNWVPFCGGGCTDAVCGLPKKA